MGQGLAFSCSRTAHASAKAIKSLRLSCGATVNNAIILLHRRRALHGSSLIRGEDAGLPAILLHPE